MATDRLVVEIQAKTKKLDSALKDTNNGLDSLNAKTKGIDKSMLKMGTVAGVAGTALKATAVAAFALATALTAVVLKSAASQKELAILSRQAKLSTDEFEALSFATKQYGINAEQIADISKDLSDKLGEFGKAGTGAFQDFADVAGLTKEQAMETAREFENLSGDQVIGEMVRRMEEAGATTNEMTFALESMGNDLSRLLPLFTSNSKELNNLTSTYKKATDQLKLTSTEINGLQDVAQSFDLMTDSLSKGATLISAQIAPLLDSFFKSVIEEVPTATQVMVDFFNSFKTPDEITNLISIQNQIIDEQEKLNDAIAAQVRLEQKSLLYTGSETGIARAQELRWEIEGQVAIIEELTEREAELNKQRLADAERLESKGIRATGGEAASGSSGTGDQIQAIADRFKSEEELLREKLNIELGIIGENDELKLQLEQEYQDKLKAIRLTADEEYYQQGAGLRDLFEKSKKDEVKINESAARQKQSTDKKYLSLATSLNTALLEDNKAINAGLVVADTASAIMASLKINPYDYLNVGVLAATGLTQLANITSSGRGGGNVTGGSSGGLSQVEAEEPTSNLNVSDTEQDGQDAAQTLTIKIEGDNNELAVALSGIMNQARVSGVIS